MKCLTCNNNHFQPQMGFHFWGFNKRQNSVVYVYYQKDRKTKK